nr:uncharacterized protein LOC129525932 [Gorilla gorilla gorilla]
MQRHTQKHTCSELLNCSKYFLPRMGWRRSKWICHTPLACASERKSRGERPITRSGAVLPRPEDDVSTAGQRLMGPPANQPLPSTDPCCVPSGKGEVKPSV